jgi:hypothetical protein
MSQQTKHLIKLLAVVSILYGIAELLLGMKDAWLSIQHFFYPVKDTFWEILFSSSLTLLFSLLIPLCAMFGGVGLLRQKKWGWSLSLIVSLIIFTRSCSETINFALVSYFFKTSPAFNLIPTYITSFISLTFIAILNRESIKNMFRQLNSV